MTSKPQMIFNCSINTLEQIFEEVTFARELCESYSVFHLSPKQNFTVLELQNDCLKVEYEIKSSGISSCEINFYKVSDSIIKCKVEHNLGAASWLSASIILFLVGFFTDSEFAYGLGMFTLLVMSCFALICYLGINSVCSRIKRKYEKNENFLQMHGQLSKNPTIKNNIAFDDVIDKSYFINNGLRQEGPLFYEDLKSKLSLHSYVWYEGIPDWVLASGLTELRDLIPQSPPPFNIQIEQKKSIPPSFNIPANPPAINYKMK